MIQAIAKWQRASWARWLLAGGLTAASAAIVSAQQPPSQFRSLTDVRPRIPDEHDRPYFRETQSHRGWEIREPQFTVFAATSADDAKWAAAQVSHGWQQASSLANRWTTTHHNPDFGLSTLQVVINNEPLRDRDAPATTLNVVGIQTQVHINVGPGQPTLPQQVARLREGAAFAMLHAAGLDSSAPPWVVAGIAAVAGRTGLNTEELKPIAVVDQAARIGGQQWRYRRSTEDTLDYPRLDQEEATSQMTFLLKGNDGEHAPALFAALQQAGGEAVRAAVDGGGFRPFPGDSQPATPTGLDQLFGDLSAGYASWKQNPQVGQPVFEPAKDAASEVVAAEQEMLVLLKLTRRLSVTIAQRANTAGSATATVINRGPVRTKIITYNRASGAAAISAPAKQTTPPTSFAALAARLSDPAQPVWATIDADGSLLLSTDTERLQDLLAIAEQRYSLESSEGRTVLVRRLEGNQVIRGWLQDNPQDNLRPLAKFEVAGNRRGSKTVVPPQKQGQVTGLSR
jgi:hypothetical protein